MPSAAASSGKQEKQATPTNGMQPIDPSIDNNSPIRQVLVIIEHKIRNLEKRKGKLESYRDIEKSGKELSSDQRVAVSKYNEVAHTLDFARELSKQILQIATGSEKELKKKQKKDEMMKKQNELSRIREVLIIQDILKMIFEDGARDDFLNGTNGACQLAVDDLDALEQLYEDTRPKRGSAPIDVPYKHLASRSADHLSAVIDGREKEIGKTTFTNVKGVLKTIQKCGYFDKSAQPVPVMVVDESTVPIPDEVNQVEEEIVEITEIEVVDVVDEHQTYEDVAPEATAVPVPTFPPQQQPHLVGATHQTHLQPVPVQQIIQPSQPIPPQSVPVVQQPQPIPLVPAPHPTTATTVRAVEQAYFKQYMQQIRPLTDVIGTGNFFFLQDSELDSPDLVGPPGSGVYIPQPQPQQLQQPQQILPPPPAQQIVQQSYPIPQPYVQPPIVPQPQIFTNIKATDVPTSQITGFASPNAPIPMSVVVQPNVDVHLVAQQPPQQLIVPGNIPPAGFVTGPPTIVPSKSPQPDVGRLNEAIVDLSEQRQPEIGDWNEEVANGQSESSEWIEDGGNQFIGTSSGVPDGNEWVGNETVDDSNTWTNSQRFYRNGRGGGGGYNRSGRSTGGSTNGYRNRPSNSYQSRQGGGGSSTTNTPGTYYRNNDSYYQNGGGNNGSYRGDKQSDGYRSGSFRSRESRDPGSMRTNDRSNRNHSDSGDRGPQQRRNQNTSMGGSSNRGRGSYGNRTNVRAHAPPSSVNV